MTLLEKLKFTSKIYNQDIDDLTIRIEKLKSRRKEKICAVENIDIIISEEKQ